MIRSRKIYSLFLLLILSTIVVLICLKPIPLIRNIVHETNVKINSIKAFHGNSEESHQAYLEYLGFSDANVNYSHAYQSIVVGSAVSTGDFENAFAFLQSVNVSLSTIYDAIILFDIGLRSGHINQLKKKCNRSNHCQIRNFQFDKFPNHISQSGTRSYKPLAVQMLLREFETVIWMDLCEAQFLTFVDITKEWWKTVRNGFRSGVQGWAIMWPTSSVTHPSMFGYFHLQPEHFYFHRMISTKYFIITRSEFVRKKT